MKDQTKQKLEQFFQTEQNKLFIEEPSTDIDIENTQIELNILLDETYKAFVKKYGGAYAGIEIFPCSKKNTSKADQTVMDYTRSFRKSYSSYPVYSSIMDKSYVIAMDGSGNPFIVNPEGEIQLIDHDSGAIETIATSFEELITRYI